MADLRTEAQIENPLLGQQNLRLYNKQEWLEGVESFHDDGPRESDEVGEHFTV